MAYVRIAPLGNAMAVVGDAVLAMVYRAYAIRPYKWRKTIIAHPFPNSPKTTSDAGKTTSYAGKIMSDVIQTTSDLFSPICNTLKTTTLPDKSASLFIYWLSTS